MIFLDKTPVANPCAHAWMGELSGRRLSIRDPPQSPIACALPSCITPPLPADIVLPSDMGTPFTAPLQQFSDLIRIKYSGYDRNRQGDKLSELQNKLV